MKPQEIVWRIRQKQLQKHEYKKVFSLHKPVTEIPLPENLRNLHIDINKLSINWANTEWTFFSELNLFDVFPYESYRNKWNAGFQTTNCWPEGLYSPTINISQRIDIGDIRTNWELNRHFQFAALAKSYYCTKDKKYFVELEHLFTDWNQHNLFLHGVEWTSAMEMAIRVNSWVYTYAFLKQAHADVELLAQIEHGIICMAYYIEKHHARFSSANNHLIVEMYAVALAGIITGYSHWKDYALYMLTNELPKQNHEDGVNREMSLHYQSFVMEAYGLIGLIMMKNGMKMPAVWKRYLTAMSRFIADSTDDYGVTMEFGDNDEGKILDLQGNLDNYHQYVLNLMGCILDEKYTDFEWHENLKWIIPDDLKGKKEKYIPGLICSRKAGGYTFLRSKDRRVLIGIDHADLGFGSIAAHGHADALSFQMFVEGRPIFVDPGTYNYHFTPEERNIYRSTAAHNTVVIDELEQSKILGPFMWGKRTKASLTRISGNKDIVELEVMCVNGKRRHIRQYRLRDTVLEIADIIEGGKQGIAFFHISPDSRINVNGTAIPSNTSICLQNEHLADVSNKYYYSNKYNSKKTADCCNAVFTCKTCTKITWRN